MAKFSPKATPAPAIEGGFDLASRVEVIDEPRTLGRPPGEPRKVFGTRLRDETIAEVEALKVGLRLKLQGEAIERAVAFYRAHIIEKTRRELRIAPEVGDDAVLLKAFKADD